MDKSQFITLKSSFIVASSSITPQTDDHSQQARQKPSDSSNYLWIPQLNISISPIIIWFLLSSIVSDAHFEVQNNLSYFQFFQDILEYILYIFIKLLRKFVPQYQNYSLFLSY